MGVARKAYKQEWKRVDQFYGQKGKPPPPLHIISARNAASMPPEIVGASAATVATPKGPQVYASKMSLRKLGKFSTYADRNNLDHEWTHAFQKPELGLIGHGKAAERGAYREAKAISHNNPQKRKAAVKKLSPWVRRGQFGLPYLKQP